MNTSPQHHCFRSICAPFCFTLVVNYTHSQSANAVYGQQRVIFWLLARSNAEPVIPLTPISYPTAFYLGF